MKALFGLVSGWVTKYAMLLMGVAIAVCLAALVERQLELASERTAHANDLTKWANERRAAADEARTWQQGTFRAYEAATRNANDARDKLNAQAFQLAALQARFAALSVDRARLQRDLDEYASGGPGDSLGACQARARVLAQQLGEGAQLVVRAGDLGRRLAEVAGQAAIAEAGNAIEVNRCFEAWPGNDSPAHDGDGQ